jgi:hypothetical protein
MRGHAVKASDDKSRTAFGHQRLEEPQSTTSEGLYIYIYSILQGGLDVAQQNLSHGGGAGGGRG